MSEYSSYFYERRCYICERSASYPKNRYVPKKSTHRVRFTEPSKMLKSASPQYPSRGSDARVIRLTTDQEAVLQEQFNRWPRAHSRYRSTGGRDRTFRSRCRGLVLYPISTVEERTGSGRKSWFALTLTLFSNVVTVYLKM
ncbi:uncharacterized protein LOC102672342 isoform X1 [Apis dorsata]|uniref:uncharacterized protein LOC102672342 isoform X1 n=1 Tax=Apis dorsata TaxID=7462 RepID=UPI0003DF7340|nr:uncharacterized protein LOC102672342 isoform X1 [Apis dorsata]